MTTLTALERCFGWLLQNHLTGRGHRGNYSVRSISVAQPALSGLAPRALVLAGGALAHADDARQRGEHF